MLGQYPKTHLVLILVAHRLAECRISIGSMSQDKIEWIWFIVTIKLRLKCAVAFSIPLYFPYLFMAQGPIFRGNWVGVRSWITKCSGWSTTSTSISASSCGSNTTTHHNKDVFSTRMNIFELFLSQRLYCMANEGLYSLHFESEIK